VAEREHEHDHPHDHDHSHDHGPEQEQGVGETSDISAWAASAPTTICPACGASGAVMLGGGVFCPTCREVSTSPGYAPP
jgi:hypothetical protein